MNENQENKSLSKKELLQAWWSTIRPESLPVSIVPVIVGTLLGVADGSFHVWVFIAMLVASVLVHLGANIFNEYYDYKRGLDDTDSVGIGGALVRGDIKPQAAAQVALSFFGIAILLGAYISFETSWWVAVIGSVSMAVGYFYTGNPLPIAYTPFGELFSGIFMGSIIIGLSYFIQTMTLTVGAVLISLPVTIFVAGILLTNNIRDVDGDKANGRNTFAILVGRKKATTTLAAIFIVAYLLTGLYIIMGILPLISIVIFISAPKAYSVVKKLRGKTEAAQMMSAMEAVGQTHAIYGALLSLSLFVHLLF